MTKVCQISKSDKVLIGNFRKSLQNRPIIGNNVDTASQLLAETYWYLCAFLQLRVVCVCEERAVMRQREELTPSWHYDLAVLHPQSPPVAQVPALVPSSPS